MQPNCRLKLATDLEISRVLTGLWQVADMERDGSTLDPEAGAAAMAAYVEVEGEGPVGSTPDSRAPRSAR